MVFCKAVALATSVCISIAYSSRIKAPSKWIIEEHPLAEQRSGAASAARISHHDDELSLEELLALDDRVMPATARPSVPAIPRQMATRSKKRKAPEVPATAQPSVPATELHEAQPSVPATNIFLKSSGITAAQPSYEATLPSAASKKRKGPEAPQHTFDGALQDEVVVLQGRAVREEEMLLGNSSAHDLELELDEVDHSGTEGGINIVEVLSYMVDELEYEADGSLVGPLHEAQTSGGWIEDLWGKTPDDVDFEEAMQKYEEAKCTKWIGKSGSKLKMQPLKECCKVARIWSSCDHGRRSLASMIRSFDTLCKRFPSLPRHRIAKAASLQDLGLFAASVEGSGSGIGRYNHQWNWLQDPCVTKLTKMPLAQLKKCCADNGLDTTGVGPVLVARLKAHGRASVLKR